LPLTEWSVPAAEIPTDGDTWDSLTFFGPSREPGCASLFELSESSLRPIIFLDEPAAIRAAAAKHLAAVVENYERHGQANSPGAEHYFWSEEQFAAAAEKSSQIHLEQLGLSIGSHPQFELPSRPSARFHGDVVACINEIKSQLSDGGRV